MRGRAAPLAAGAAGVLLAAALFAGGGSGDARLFWIGSAAILAAAVAYALVFASGRVNARLDGLALAAVLLLAAFVAWNGVTVVWSIAPDRSWAYTNRGFVYVAFLLLGIVVARTLERPAARVAAGLAVLFAAVLVCALAGKVVPALGPDTALNARLRDPIGYWNALALVCAMALPLGLWLAGARTRARTLAGALLVYVALVALTLTYSRGGVAVAGFVIALFAWLERRRQLTLLVAAAAGVPAAAVVAWAFSRPALVDAGRTANERKDDGVLFAIALVLGGAAALALAYALVEVLSSRMLVRRRVIGVVYGAAALAAVVALSVSATNPLDAVRDFFNPAAGPVEQSPGRLTTLASNNRWAWWKEAWQIFEEHPIGGAGAASFKIARRPLRESEFDVTVEPHNLPLQFLSETGLIGFVLIVGALGAGAWAARSRLGGLEQGDRRAAVALALVAVAYLLHGLVDFHWNYLAVSAPFFFVCGVLLACGPPPDPAVRRPFWALAAVLVGVAAVVSLGAPWLADRRVAEARDVFVTNPGRAVELASEARDLNPLSLDPLHTLAVAEEARGRLGAAHAYYRDAVELQPENADAWFALGEFELEALDDPHAALRHLNEAYALDPRGPAGTRGGALDRARCAADPATCPR